MDSAADFLDSAAQVQNKVAVNVYFSHHESSAGISWLWDRTSGSLSSVSATKQETTDENGEQHISMMQKHRRLFHPEST